MMGILANDIRFISSSVILTPLTGTTGGSIEREMPQQVPCIEAASCEESQLTHLMSMT